MGRDEPDRDRRRWLRALVAGTAAVTFSSCSSAMPKNTADKFTVFTFGDSILDCARYNDYGVHPGQLIVRNDDGLFPGFKGRDLASLSPAQPEPSSRAFAELQRCAPRSCLPYCEPVMSRSAKSGKGRRFQWAEGELALP